MDIRYKGFGQYMVYYGRQGEGKTTHISFNTVPRIISIKLTGTVTERSDDGQLHQADDHNLGGA